MNDVYTFIQRLPYPTMVYRLEDEGRLLLVAASNTADRCLGARLAPGTSLEISFPQIAATDIPAQLRAIAEQGGTWSTHDMPGVVGLHQFDAFQPWPGHVALTCQPMADPQHLLTIIDAVPDRIYIKDRQSRFVLTNRATAAYMGVASRDDLVGKSDFDFYPEAEARHFYEDEQRVMATGEPLIGQEERILDQGHTGWLLTTKVPLRDARGEIIGIVGIGRDITQRKHMAETLTQERNLLRTLIDAVPDSIFVKDVQSRFIIGNRAVAAVMGFDDPNGLVGKTDYDVYTEEEADAFRADEEAVIATGEPVISKLEAVQSRAHGEVRWYATTKVPLRDGTGAITGVVGLGRDMTELRHAERALRLQRDLGVALSAADDLETVYKQVLRACFSLPGIDCGAIYLFDTMTGHLKLVAYEGVSAAYAAATSHYLADSPNAVWVKRGESSFGAYGAEEALVAGLPDEGMRAAAHLPIQHQNEVIGSLNIASRRLTDIPAPLRHVLEAIAAQIGGAIARIRATNALLESRRRYQVLFDSMLDAYALHQIILDQDGRPIDYRFLDVNPAFERLTGLRREDVVGKRVLEVMPGTQQHWIEAYGRVALAGEVAQFENVASAATDRWLDVVAFQPEPNQVATILQDVTARRQATETLRRERDLWNKIMETSPVGVVAVSAAGQVTFINAQAEAILGISREQALGRSFHAEEWQIQAPDGGDLPRTELPFARVMRTGEAVYGYEHGIQRPDGTLARLAINGAPIFDEAGDIEQVVMAIEDITEREQAATELAATKALLQAAIDQSPAGILIADAPDGAIRVVNLAALGIRGADAAELTHIQMVEHATRWQTYRPDSTPYPSEELPLSRAILHGDVTRGEEVIIRNVDGEDRWVLANAGPLRDHNGAITGGIVVFADITPRKRAQQALERRLAFEQMFAAISGKLLVWTTTNEADAIDAVLRRCMEYAGVDRCTISRYDDTGLEVLHSTALRPDLALAVGTRFTGFGWLYQQGSAGHTVRSSHINDLPPQAVAEREAVRSTGLQAFMQVPLRAGTRLLGNLGFGCLTASRQWPDALVREMELVADMIARALLQHEAEEALQQSEATLRTVLRAAPIGIGVTHDRTIKWTNAAFQDMLGYSAAEMEGMSTRRLHDSETDYQRVRHLRILQLHEHGMGVIETRFVTKGGRSIDVLLSMAPTDPAKPEGSIIWTVLNITARKRLAAQQVETERLQVALEKEKELGELKNRFMSIISHEFRTPLAVMDVTAELLYHYGDRLSVEERQKEYGKLRRQIEHLSQMLQEVALVTKTSGGHQEYDPQPHDLVALCQRIIDEMQTTVGKSHHIHFTASSDLGAIMLDERLMGYVLSNLLSNAIKYSPPESTIRVAATRHDHEVSVQVSDEGRGIAPEDLERLFEPYHRGDNVGEVQGLGLGLKIVQDCVELHQGHIEVDSTPGEGSTFTVYLPAS